jgi:hypothetical protein
MSNEKSMRELPRVFSRRTAKRLMTKRAYFSTSKKLPVEAFTATLSFAESRSLP